MIPREFIVLDKYNQPIKNKTLKIEVKNIFIEHFIYKNTDSNGRFFMDNCANPQNIEIFDQIIDHRIAESTKGKNVNFTINGEIIKLDI